MKWIIDYALDRCVISIYAWPMLGFTQPYKASRVKPLLVLEITTNAHIAISLCFNNHYATRGPIVITSSMTTSARCRFFTNSPKFRLITLRTEVEVPTPHPSTPYGVGCEGAPQPYFWWGPCGDLCGDPGGKSIHSIMVVFLVVMWGAR